MLKNVILKKRLADLKSNRFSKLIKIIVPVFFLTGFLFFPFNVTKAQEDLKFKEYENLLEYTEELKADTVIYNYKTTKEEQKTFNNLNEVYTERKEDTEVYFDVKENKKLYKLYSGKQYRKIGDDWFKFETATTTKTKFFDDLEKTVPIENLFDKMLSLFEFKKTLAQVTEYSENGDGAVAYTYNTADNWTTLHNATTGNVVNYISDTQYPGVANFNRSYPTTITRQFLPFDTSIIDDGATIDTATLNYRIGDKWVTDNDAYAYMVAVTSTVVSTSTLATSDYDNLTFTAITDYSRIEDMTTASYIINNFLNPDTDIIKTGYTKIAVIEGHDLNNDKPSLPANDNFNRVAFLNSEFVGTDKDPYLLVTVDEGVIPEDPTSTTTSDFYPCEIPENTLIQRFTGCENIYTTSTTTPDEVRYFYYDIPLILFFIFLCFCIFPFILIVLYISMKKNEKKKSRF